MHIHNRIRKGRARLLRVLSPSRGLAGWLNNSPPPRLPGGGAVRERARLRGRCWRTVQIFTRICVYAAVARKKNKKRGSEWVKTESRKETSAYSVCARRARVQAPLYLGMAAEVMRGEGERRFCRAWIDGLLFAFILFTVEQKKCASVERYHKVTFTWILW